MPHLHLPADHTDADLVLAADLARAMGSAELFVTWTHAAGPGAVPEIDAVLREPRPGLVVELLATLIAGVTVLWRVLTTGSAAAPGATGSASVPLGARRAAGEPSA
jgi:hypothetical protein